MIDKKMIKHLKKKREQLLEKANLSDDDLKEIRIIDNIFVEEGIELELLIK